MEINYIFRLPFRLSGPTGTAGDVIASDHLLLSSARYHNPPVIV